MAWGLEPLTGMGASTSCTAYNPKKAKALLEEAGAPPDLEFTIYLYTLPGLPEQSGYRAGPRAGF